MLLHRIIVSSFNVPLYLSRSKAFPLVRSSYKSRMSKPKVYVTRSDIPKEAIDLLKERCEVSMWTECCPVPRETLLENIQGKNAVFCTLSDAIDKIFIEKAGTALRVVGTMSVGYDHIDVEELKSRGIKVGYTPDVLTDAVADLTVGLLLATSRRFFEANQAILKGTWPSWNPVWMCGQGLKDSIVGIVGFGRIGMAVAKRLQPFGINKVLYTSRSSKAYGQEINAQHVSFDFLLAESDFIVVTCSLTQETSKMFDDKAFGKMKNDAIFINTSRGDLVDQEALFRALQSNKIKAAGLDVMSPEPLPPSHPLLSLSNCVLLPHIGSATKQTRTDMAVLTANNILAALDGRAMPTELC